MRIRPALALFAVGAAAIATLVFAGERLAFEAQALLLRPTFEDDWSVTQPPDVTIRCDKPDCPAGAIFYEVVVDRTGRPRAIRFEQETRYLERSAREKGAKAILAARWPAPESGGPIRTFQQVLVFPHERLPTRHVPFPETEGQAVSITLERETQLGIATEYAVTLDSDGAVEFCGQSYLKSPGPHRDRISSAAFEALVQEFRKADFFSLDDRYSGPAVDGPTHLLRIRVGDQEKTVVDYYGRAAGMPTAVSRLQDAVDETAGTSRWIGSWQEWGTTGGDMAHCPAPLSDSTARALPS